MSKAQFWVDRLQLQPHPEGGYYRETYRAELELKGLPPTFHGARSASTAIYFLLEGADFSAFHRIASDEMWHFYAGGPLAVEVLHPDGTHETMLLGGDPEAGEVLQAVVPAGCWFGSHLPKAGTYALAGCTVAPGFDFADFEMAQRSDLLLAYPGRWTLIERLTRGE